MKKLIFLIVLLPLLFLACTNDGNSSSDPKPEKTEKKYHVTYVSKFGTAPVDNNEYSAGDTITLPDMQNGCESSTVFRFKSWTTDGKSYNAGASYVINGDTTFTAKLETNACEYGCDSSCTACALPKKYHVTYEAPFGTAPVDNTEYSDGSTVTIKKPECDSFCEGNIANVFQCWIVNGNQYQPDESFIIRGNTTITAVFTSQDCSASNQICAISENCAFCMSNSD